jgi:hypothetical protein
MKKVISISKLRELQQISSKRGKFAGVPFWPGGLMASIYKSERDAIDRSPDSLGDLALRAGLDQSLFDADT